MSLALGCCERRGDVIDVREPASPQIDGLRAIGNRLPRFLHADEPASESLVHDVLQGLLERVPELLDPGATSSSSDNVVRMHQSMRSVMSSLGNDHSRLSI